MKKFISIWSILAVCSAGIALDFYLAIKGNAHPNCEQIFMSCFIIGFFVICALVFACAHIENIIYKNK